MKYHKMKIDVSLKDLELNPATVRIVLNDSDGNMLGAEQIYVKTLEDGSHVLQNHAKAFMPFPSWGVIIPPGVEFDATELKLMEDLPLHPEAWDEFTAKKLINTDGEFTPLEES